MSSDFRAHRVPAARRRAIASLVAAGTVAATVAAVSTGGPSVQADAGSTIQILSFNDYHGHVEADTAGSIDGSFRGPAAGGGEFLSAKLAELRTAGTAAGVDASFTVAAGDNIGGSPFFSGLVRDEPSVESLNEMGLDISGVGNHEFDDGIDELLRMQNGGCFDRDGDGLLAGRASAGSAEATDDCFFPDAPYQGADFQWLAANVIETATGNPLDLDDGRGIQDLGGYSIVDADGTDIAFIGMTLDGTDELVAAAGVAGYTFEDEIATANALIPEIKAAGAEAIFVLLHEGGIPTEFAIDGCVGISGPVVAINQGLNAEIDAVISGHTQQPYNCELQGRPVISAWEHGKVVSEMVFEIDADGDVDRSTLSVVNHPVIQSELTADASITDVITKWSPIVDELANDEVGRISEDITRGGNPTGSDRGVESEAGNLVADAQLFGVREAGIEADVAFMNPGGLRSDLTFAASEGETEDGIVTYGEAFTFQPFNNTMLVLPMTGAQIKSVLEEQCQPSDQSRPILHLGVSEGFTYDLTITTRGSVCTSVDVSNVQLDGVDIVDTTVYKVAVNNFLADGGDSFDTFAEVDPTDRLPGPQDIDALIDYLQSFETPVSAPGTDRVNETITRLPASQNPLVPVRLLDTRPGDNPTVDGEFQGAGRLGAGNVIELQVTGRGGIDAGAAAVALNVGLVRPTANGFITVYPCDQDRPLASNINANTGDILSNAVFTKLSAEGTACIYSSVETHLYADATSVVPSGGSPTPVLPARLLETRTLPGSATVDGLFLGSGPVAAGAEVELQVTGRGATGEEVPADAKSVILNVGAINAQGKGFLTVYPCGADRPNASSVNFDLGRNASNSVSSQIGDDGKVCIYTSVATNLIADVNAFVPVNGTPEPVVPARLLETRTFPGTSTIDGDFYGEGPLDTGETVTLTVADRGGVGPNPALVTLNVAAIRAAARGFVTVYPCDAEDGRPLASTVNYEGGDIRANSVAAKVSAAGTVCIYTSQSTELIVDVTGSVDPIVPAFPAT